jgi:hypothetical protein
MLPEVQEFEDILKEATAEVEVSLTIPGWSKLGVSNSSELTSASRALYVQKSRYLYSFDPLASRSVRMWTDYSFGSGISYHSENKAVQDALDKFWKNPKNRKVLSEAGQRKSSDKMLADGEVFFALFLGSDGEVTIRWIDPLEITEIITDPDDIEGVKFYKREWTNAQGVSNTSYYRSTTNQDNESVPDSAGKAIVSTEDALVYHLPFNTIGQRGNPLLLPVIDWIEQYRRFLASRIAIVRALARFAWKNKVTGGAVAVAAAKAVIDGKTPQPASTWFENQASSLDPIKTDTGSANAKDDGRMIKLQVCAGVGIPEQYYGDIATGNLATAKTVELPLLKQFSCYQGLWGGGYTDIFNVVLEHNNISEDQRFIDLDWPPIAPDDIVAALTAISSMIASFPDLQDVPEVQKQALLDIGVNNVDEILKLLKTNAEKKKQNPDAPVPAVPSVPAVPPQPARTAEARAIEALMEIRNGLEHDSH